MKIFKHVLILALSFLLVSCFGKEKNKQAEKSSSQSRSIASTKNTVKRKLKIRKRAKILNEVKKATKGFVIPRVYLRRLGKKERTFYHQSLFRAVKEFNRALDIKGKVVDSKTQPMELFNMFFEKAYAQSRNLCAHSGWVCNISEECSGSTRFAPDECGEFNDFMRQFPRNVWNISTQRCMSSGQGYSSSRGEVYLCPPVGLELINISGRQEVRLMCNSSSTGSTSGCASQIESDDNDFARLQSMCDEGDRDLPSISNFTCSDLDNAENAYRNQLSRQCDGITSSDPNFVQRMCSRMNRAIAQSQEDVTDATEPPPADEAIPSSRSCMALTAEQTRDGEGASDHWQAVMQFARNNCNSNRNRNVDFLANERYGVCTNEFTGSLGGLNPTEVARAGGGGPGRAVQFAQIFGLTPNQYEELMCGVDSVGEFRGRLENFSRYRSNSKRELMRIVANDLGTYGNQLDSFFRNNQSTYRAMSEFFEINLERTNDLAGSTGEELKNNVENDAELLNQAMGILINMRDNQRDRTRGVNLEDNFRNYLRENNIRRDEDELRMAMHIAMTKVLVPPAIDERVNAAESWLAGCMEQAAPETAEEIDPETGVRPNTFDSTAQCRYVVEDDVESWALGTDHENQWRPGDRFFVRRGNECYQTRPPYTVSVDESGVRDIARAELTLPNSEVLEDEIVFTSADFRSGRYTLYRQNCGVDDTLRTDEEREERPGSPTAF